MRTLKYNGENWYIDDRSLWKRVRQWIIWIGGWEKANNKGWQFTIDYGNRKGLMRPTPISLLGHTLTLYGWGGQVRFWRRRYLVWSKTSGVYVLSDGTPPGEHKEYTKGFFILRNRKRRRW